MAYVPNSGSVAAWLQSDNASVIGITQGSIATVIIGGSILTSSTANQSVSGTVGASVIGLTPVSVSNFPTTQNISGSVVATQGTNPWTVVSSIAGGIFPISGSVAAVVTNTPSISGTVLVNNGSVVAFQGTSPWVVNYQNSSIITVSSGSIAAVIIGGSILTSSTANQSVSGTVGASIIGNVNTTITSIATAGQVMGSVATLQGTNPWIINTSGSVAAVIIGGSIATATTNSSVMLLNGANTIGSVTTLQGTNPWVIVGSVYGIGSTVAFQGTSPWVVNFQNSSVIAISTGSVVALPTGNQSVSGTVGASIIGIAPVTLTANTVPASALAFLGATTSITAANTSVVTVTGYPLANLQITSSPSMTGTILFEGSADNSSWLPITGYNQATNALASVTTTADGNWAFNTAGLQTFRARLSAWTAGSITGKVFLSPADARPFTQYLVGTPSISGTVLLGTGAAVIGSVTALQGTNPWIQTFSNSSIIAINAGSVVAISSGSVITVLQTASIVGTYSEDVASGNNDKGLLTLGIRNDTVSSLVNADLDYTGWSTDSAGRHLIKPFSADESRLDTATSVVSTSVTALFNSVVGLRLYVTDVMVANTGASATLVTFKDGSTSILGYTIAPAGGGSNINGMAFPMRTAPAQDFTFTAATASSILYVTAKGYKAP